MKFYKTWADVEKAPRAVWTASQAEAASRRAALYKEGIRRSDVATDEVDVPTSKKELLQWLNENCN